MATAQSTTKTIRVLYVDDYEMDRELVRDALSRDGAFQLTETASREEFKRQLADGGFDLVLSDFNILGFEGLQVIDLVRERCPDVPVVIVTGTGSEKIAIAAWKRGAADYVIKTPEHIRRLPQTICSALEKSRMECQHRLDQQAVVESEKRFRMLAESLPVALTVMQDNRRVYCNRYAEEMSGYSRDELMGREAGTITHPDFRDRILQQVGDTLQNGVAGRQENQFVCKNGQIRWSDFSTAPFEWKGRPAVLGAAIDITERKRTEMVVRGMHDVTSDPTMEFDEKFQSLLHLGCERFGLELAILGRVDGTRFRITHLVAPDGFDIAPGAEFELDQTYCRRTLEVGAPVAVENAGQSDLCGHPLYRAFQLEAYLGAPIYLDGRAAGTLSFLSRRPRSTPFNETELDFTQLLARWVSYELEQQQTSQSLRESEQRYRSLFEQAHDLILLIDSDSGRILDCNESVVATLGYTRDEICQLTIANIEINESPEEVTHHMEKMLHEGGDQFETRCCTKSGDIRNLEIVASTVDINGKAYLQAICTDITERNEAKERLRLRDAQLAHMSRVSAMGEMAGALAHEINQPLGAIANYAGRCATMLEAENTKPMDLSAILHEIDGEVHRASGIINRLRSFVSKTTARKSSVNVNELVIETDKLLHDKGGAIMRLELDQSLPLIQADSVQIQQVLVNLIQNAIEAMANEVARDREIVVRTRKDGESVGIEVTNSGDGLTDEQCEKIFEPYFTTKQEGMGLGLSISRTIIENHKGKIWATSNPKQGTTVAFTLPVNLPYDGPPRPSN